MEIPVLLLKQTPYFVLNFICRHRVSMLAVICGNRGFFVIQTQSEYAIWVFKWQERRNRGGGKSITKGIA